MCKNIPSSLNPYLLLEMLFFIWNNGLVRKTVKITKQADKEIKKFSHDVQTRIKVIFDVLSRDGKLVEPYGKKIDSNLFEIRIKYKGQWRILYAYLLKELTKAKIRLKEYQI
ncbi:type II toxin-antitoxin system RelE/ParE family toxin [Patescibacteria group bacterium]|nr:type II toxin-antitoxin system RelE/ParE family toxin [Patescibacteria group bacterium]